LRIDKIKQLGFKPSLSSKEAVKATTREIINDIS